MDNKLMMALRSLWREIKPFALMFFIIETALRIVFLIREWGNVDPGLLSLGKMFGVGFVFDASTFAYMLAPLSLALVVWPGRWSKGIPGSLYRGFIFFVIAYILVFGVVAEWFFWDEFSARFNFVAVDYLIYMDEVLGNIRESYPMPLILSGVGAASLLATGIYLRFRRATQAVPLFRWRMIAAIGFVIPAFLAGAVMKNDYAESGANRYADEISKNGIHSLFAAYWSNELPYDQFYITMSQPQMISELNKKLRIDHSRPVFEKENDLSRFVSHGNNIRKQPNIILITVESLSADYLGVFGNTENLTPNLDALARNSLLFTNCYAIGTRTVYGLTATALSIPPIPGNAILRRPDNEHLFSLGSILDRLGYQSSFIYGGYGYFDNMNYFFSHNGYNIIDRSDLSDEGVTFSNIWGVCDEDLFRRVIKESDRLFAEGKPFFHTIMTTSNHLPFTYPDGRIDIPSHTGRIGGVKYTDWAIGKLMREAREKPWFDNTIFVIVADHTAGGAGKSYLDPNKYHIPLIIYAPKIVAPRTIASMASQIDIGPTLLGLLGASYVSRFYGQDILVSAPERAFISNYQKVGYLTPKDLTILEINKQSESYRNTEKGWIKEPNCAYENLKTAVCYFQNASLWKTLNQDFTDDEYSRDMNMLRQEMVAKNSIAKPGRRR